MFWPSLTPCISNTFSTESSVAVWTHGARSGTFRSVGDFLSWNVLDSHWLSRLERGRVMSCHVLTQQSCHVSGQVLSCRFFGVIFHVSRLVASASIEKVPLFLSCYVLLSLLESCHVVSCNDLRC